MRLFRVVAQVSSAGNQGLSLGISHQAIQRPDIFECIDINSRMQNRDRPLHGHHIIHQEVNGASLIELFSALVWTGQLSCSMMRRQAVTGRRRIFALR